MSSSTDRTPVVSIVVAVMNGAQTLERCIDSIACQTFQDRELIIKDGGSTDGSVAILERRSPDITYWETGRDRGVYDAWNTVLDRCRGEWICFLGCDDQFAEPTSLARLAAATRPDPPDLICALAAVTRVPDQFVRVMGRPWNWAELKRSQRIAHPGMLHRAGLFERHGRFNTDYRIAGDYEFLLRLGPDTRAVFVDQVTVRMGANGLSERLARRAFRETWRAQARHPEIGAGNATLNYGIAFAKHLVQQALSRR